MTRQQASTQQTAGNTNTGDLPAESALARHAQRRAAGIPTVSLLLGADSAMAAETFAHWAKRDGRAVARITDGTGTQNLLTAWVAALGGLRGMRAAAMTWLAAIAGDSPETLARRLDTEPPAARRMFIERHAARGTGPSARLCLAILGDCREDLAVLPAAAELFPEAPDPALAMLVALHDLDPHQAPAVLLVSNRPDASLLNANLCLLAGLAEQAVTCVLAWALSEACWNTAVAEVPDSRCKAICREGLILVSDRPSDDRHDRDADDLRDWAARRGFGAPVPTQLRAMLAVHRASLAARSVAPSLHATQGANPHAVARSQAEATLYAILCQWPPTAAQIRLNHRLPIAFGSGDMEIDLFLVVDAVAIELDGYYHFRDVAGYCRDRRKDFLLQTHGHFVLRFHADEVATPAGLDAILERIAATIAYRRRTTMI